MKIYINIYTSLCYEPTLQLEFESTIRRISERYSKLANVHNIHPKGLRHSHASYLTNDFNVDILRLSKRLGHSGPKIALRHYSHMYPNRGEVIAENISIKTSEKNQSKFNGNQNLRNFAI